MSVSPTRGSVTPTKNFGLEEFRCKHCGELKIEQVIIDACQEIREYINQPLRVNSGYRCPTHNKNVGSKTQNHTSGKAVDLSCVSLNHKQLWAKIKELYGKTSGNTAVKKLKLVLQEGSWVHCDVFADRKNGVFQKL